MRSSSRWLLVFLGTALLGLVQPSNQPGSDKPATVEGVVINAITGDPVPRAHVTLNGTVNNEQKTFGAITKADGTFSMPGLPPGTFAAQADCVGFASPRMGGPTADWVGVGVGPGETKSDLKLKLTPNGAITGRVVDAEGEPIESGSVIAEGGLTNQYTTTDDKGQFRLGGLPPGKYRIKAALQVLPRPPEVRTDGTVEVQYAQTYFPSSLEEKGATRVPVAAGAEVSGIEIRLIRAPIVCIKGQGGGPAGGGA